MSDLISRQTAIDALERRKDKTAKGEIGSFYNTIIQHDIDVIVELPSADAVEVVRCKDCKHRWVNEHYGEKGYMKIKAMCLLDTDDPFELGRNAYDDNWFCADGERKDE